MCYLLNLKPSSYYDWANRDISAQQIYHNQCELMIRVAHDETNQCYSVDRLHAYLSAQGYNIREVSRKNKAFNAVVTNTANSDCSSQLI